MPPLSKSLLFLLFPVFCSCIYSCKGNSGKARPTGSSVVCSDTSKRFYVLDTIKGYGLRPNVPLTFLLNIESFNNKEEFKKYFVPFSAIEDAEPPDLNFKDNWFVGILIDNKTQKNSREWAPVNTQLWIDSAFTQNCRLVIPFYLLAKDPPGNELTTERRFLLYRIPRTGQFSKVYVQNKAGTLSRELKVPAAEE